MVYKVYIAQNIDSRSESDILQERDKVIDCIRKRIPEAREIASYFGPNCQFSPIERLGMEIGLMAQADIVCFTPFWEQSDECKIERTFCDIYGLKRVDIYPSYPSGDYALSQSYECGDENVA